jgi:acetyl-CoA synthetase
VNPTEAFLRARDTLFEHRDDLEAARRAFQWPALDEFNWVRDWFDVLAQDNTEPALTIVDGAGGVSSLSFAELANRSRRVARYLTDAGAVPGDRVLLMLPNVAPLWETLLAAIRLGLVVIPATSQLTADDVDDRIARGAVRHMVTNTEGAAKVRAVEALQIRLVVGGEAVGWRRFDDAREAKADGCGSSPAVEFTANPLT